MVTFAAQIACLTLAQLAPNSELRSNERAAPSASPPQAISRDLLPPASSLPSAGARDPDRASAGRRDQRGASTDWTAPAFRPGRINQTIVERSAAQRLIEESTRRQSDLALDGLATSLLDILRHNLGSPRRAQAVKSYWQLAVSVYEYQFACDEVRQLSSVAQPRTEVDQVLLAAASAAAAARKQEARVEVLRRQHALVEDARLPGLDTLPWPQDVPLVGAYRTRFNDLMVGQIRPLRLHRIDRMLPHLLDRINAHAAAVDASGQALRTLLTAGRQGSAPLSTVLDTHKALTGHRQQFLAAVLEYNSQIAEYAMSVAGVATPSEILVSTMIATPYRDPVPPDPAADGNIQQASAPERVVADTAKSIFREVKTLPSASQPDANQVVAPRHSQPDGTSSVLKRISRLNDRGVPGRASVR